MRIPRSLAIAALILTAALATPAALADGGPSPGVATDAKHALADPRTGLAYTALDGGTDTFVVARRGGRAIRSAAIRGTWGIPFVTFDLTPGGLSFDGTTLVLERSPPVGLARRSRLLVVDARTLRPRRRITLAGDFAFDALSPDGRTLFLIQHVSANDLQRYRVRAYDLERGSLDPRAIVDKTEPNMAGQPIRRLVGPGARWVYTLYLHENEYFVHALDTVHARARCLDIEWHGSTNVLSGGRLALRGKRLAIIGKDRRELTTIPLPTAPNGTSSATVAAKASVFALALAAIGGLLRARRFRGRE